MRKKLEVENYEKIKEKIQLITDPRDKALCSLLYATGGRINEVLKIKKTNIFLKEGYMLINLFTEKNPLHPKRIVPIPAEKENWLVEPILTYLNFCSETLFNFTDRSARKITHKWFSCHPHHLRHCRITHLFSVYNANPERVRLLMGWADERPIKVYSHLIWQDTKKIFE